ncbi:nucleotidyltransferase family protein [Pinirhizobacter sp.]|uniref:nucleotidyltransferase family protein n=1 Tax=Pinirhizobacter sp. TaxID=2950432 RepID=UPI002F42FCFD
MLPPPRIVSRGLRHATEALALELARPGGPIPAWDEAQWRLASAAAAIHGVAPLMAKCQAWQGPHWSAFTASQREHVEVRHQRIEDLLSRIDQQACIAGIATVPLKGSALHAIGLYQAGDRPMADIDLLVREGDIDAMTAVLQGLGYVQSFSVWKHRVLRPVDGERKFCLGEHRDTPVNIELHTRIQERLPVAMIDITERIFPGMAHPGLNAYPSNGALMSHLLLHAAGNICNRSMRLLHLHDIALLAARMSANDWDQLWAANGRGAWWALPALAMVDRYYRHAIPGAVTRRLAATGRGLLRMVSRRRTLTEASCTGFWHHTLHGIEWFGSFGEMRKYLENRLRPSAEALQEQQDMIRTQLWLRERSWVDLPRGRRFLRVLTKPVPRPDALYAVRAAFDDIVNPVTPTPQPVAAGNGPSTSRYSVSNARAV